MSLLIRVQVPDTGAISGDVIGSRCPVAAEIPKQTDAMDEVDDYRWEKHLHRRLLCFTMA